MKKQMQGMDESTLALKKAHRNRVIRETMVLYLMLLPLVVLVFIFSYKPMYGILIAFQDYFPGKGIIGEGVKWVGLKHFERFINSYYFWRLIKNTLVMSGMALIFCFPAPIIFAILLNEVAFPRLRKTIQTISYLPHFISTVVVAGMALSFIGSNGLIPNALDAIGIVVKSLNTNAAFYPWMITFLRWWQGFGWASILYLSTITSVDPGLYEAAEIDGASRLQRIWHVTVPALKNLVMMQLIFFAAGILGANSELILLLYNPAVYSTSDVIGTYIYREGLMGGQFSFGTAVSLFMSVIGFAMLYIANKVSAKVAEFSLW